jgi:hypothetical protein
MGSISCANDLLPNKKTTPVKTTARNELKYLLLIWIFVDFRKGRNKLTVLPFQVRIKPAWGKKNGLILWNMVSQFLQD